MGRLFCFCRQKIAMPCKTGRSDGGKWRRRAMFDFTVIAIVLGVAVWLIISGIKILKEYERAVIFRLGRLVQARGPGITYVIPWVEKMLRVDLRTVTMDVPPQDVITRDNVSIKIGRASCRERGEVGGEEGGVGGEEKK